MMTFVNISFNFSISPSRRFFSSNFVKDIPFAWGMVISSNGHAESFHGRQMPRNIPAIQFSSDRTSFNSADLYRFLGSYIFDGETCVCACIRVFLRRLFLGIRCFIKSSVACKYRLEIGGESWRSETSSLNRRARTFSFQYRWPLSLGPLYNFPLTYDRIDTAGRGSSIDKSGGPCATTLSFSVLNDVVTFPDALLNRVLRIFHERNWKWRYRPSQL